MLLRFILCLTAVLTLIFPATAQSDVRGIAFVQAAEQSSGICVDTNAEAAIACARAECVAGGAAQEHCELMSWCYPAGWSVDIFAQHQAGPHWHDFSCGWPTRSAAMKAAAILCDEAERPYLIECAPRRWWRCGFRPR